MIIENVLKAAQPYLRERTIKDAVVGLALIGIELDNGDVGISYTLREDLPAGCSVFSFAQSLIGKQAKEIANLVVNGNDDAQRGVGMAVLTAASRAQNLVDVNSPELTFNIKVLPTDTVGMIGFIPPVAAELSKKAKKMIIFDRGVSKSGKKVEGVYPMEDQPRLLPTCDIVILSGTTMINQTIDGLLEICSKAREVVMVGSSTPMFPEGFKGTNVTVLAGAWWKSEDKETLFRSISLAGGISHIQTSMLKKAVRVE